VRFERGLYCGTVALFRITVIAAVGCGRLGFTGVTTSDASSDATLYVSITADRMAGPATIASIADLPPGTVGLSLREALAIAANHPGPDRIAFVASVFPAAAPATITIATSLVVAGEGTIVDATGSGVIITGGVPGLDLIDVIGNGDELHGLAMQGGGVAVFATNATNLALASLTIHQPIAEAIAISGGRIVAITDCVIDRPGGSALLVRNAADVTFQRGTVKLSTKTGVVNGIEIDSSMRVHVLDSFIDPGTAWMVHLADTVDSEVTGNVIVGGDTGVVLTGATARTTVFRNVIDQPGTDSVFIDTTVDATTVLNNTLYKCSAITNTGTNTSDLNDLVSSNPLDFVNPDQFDFHLVAGSPSIDAAVDVGQHMLPNSTMRYLGAGPDLGGVESY
jgi:hypothetical protein